ncbi:MAG: hypothetical protein IPH13_16945 [Planctomycetes bacterium]|nr:hypothetical protein [Planctomycetota bacterium]MCC7173062.1 hypothetical protein [Planctomycetota bacterium]
MRIASGLIFGFVVASSIGSFAPFARGTEWRIAAGARSNGSITLPSEVDRIRIAAIEGMSLSITITGSNGFAPGVALKNDVAPLDIAPFAKGIGTSKVTISNFPVAQNMILALEIIGPGDTVGDYAVVTKRKFAKGVTSLKSLLTPPQGFTASRTFDALDDARLSFTVAPVKGSPALIGAVRLIGPLGPIDVTAFVKPKGAKRTAKNIPLQDSGEYRLEFDNVGAAGSIAVAWKVAAPKVAKKKLLEPVVLGTACGDGTGSCLQSATIAFEADTSANGSTVVLPLASTWRVLDPAKLRSGSTIELQFPDPLVPTQLRTRTFAVTSIDRSATAFVVHLDRQIPSTAVSTFTALTLPPVKLRVQNGALWNSGDASVVTEVLEFPVPEAAGVPLPHFLLAWRPFVPTAVDRFSSQIYSAGPAMTSAAALTDGARATEFSNLLAAQVAVGVLTSGQRDALQFVFDNGSITGFDPTGIDGLDDFFTFAGADLKVIAPTSALRGAVLACYATPCREAIFAVLGRNEANAPFGSIVFGNTGAGEKVQAIQFNGVSNLLFDSTYCGGTPMAYLASRVAEKALHQDSVESKIERVVANAAGALTLAHLLRVQPSAAATADAFVRIENTDLLAFLNSGSATNRVGVMEAPQLVSPSQVFMRGDAGAEGIDSFDTWLRLQFSSLLEASVGATNPTLSAYVAAMTNQPVSNHEFDANTVDLIEQNIVSTLSAEGLLPVLTSLQLDLPDEPSIP